MNEKIKKLAKESGFYINEDGIFVPTTDENVTQITTKFAALVVQESIADFYRNYLDITSNQDIDLQVARYIKDTFGVDE